MSPLTADRGRVTPDLHDKGIGVSAIINNSTATRASPSLPSRDGERRRQGLYFNCDEPYVRGHQCARLFYLEVADSDDDDPAAATMAKEDGPPLISLHAITGTTAVTTMQLRVLVGGRKFTALLDSGSTHNFVIDTAARFAGLHFQSGRGAQVVVANGDRVVCQGLAHDVGVLIGHEEFQVDCYRIPLDYYDMVLDVSFLRTLGPILWDFDDLCMASWHHGKRVLWKGVGSLRTDIPPTDHLFAMRPSASPTLAAEDTVLSVRCHNTSWRISVTSQGLQYHLNITILHVPRFADLLVPSFTTLSSFLNSTLQEAYSLFHDNGHLQALPTPPALQHVPALQLQPFGQSNAAANFLALLSTRIDNASPAWHADHYREFTFFFNTVD